MPVLTITLSSLDHYDSFLMEPSALSLAPSRPLSTQQPEISVSEVMNYASPRMKADGSVPLLLGER